MNLGEEKDEKNVKKNYDDIGYSCGCDNKYTCDKY